MGGNRARGGCAVVCQIVDQLTLLMDILPCTERARSRLLAEDLVPFL